jgi:hypothetical protein
MQFFQCEVGKWSQLGDGLGSSRFPCLECPPERPFSVKGQIRVNSEADSSSSGVGFDRVCKTRDEAVRALRWMAASNNLKVSQSYGELACRPTSSWRAHNDVGIVNGEPGPEGHHSCLMFGDSTKKVSWAEANDQCINMHAHLLTFKVGLAVLQWY